MESEAEEALPEPPEQAGVMESAAIPPVLQRVLSSDAREELLGIAHFLDPKNQKALTLVFHTPIGDVKCQVKWSEKMPQDLSRHERLMLIQVKSSEQRFSPTPGADLEISFEGKNGRLKVMCLAPPQNLYPGIDLFCFLPQTGAMEKNGQLKEGAPSVVSGNPSDTEDAGGDPIVEGEKSAAFTSRTEEEFVANEAHGKSDPVVADFDKTREA